MSKITASAKNPCRKPTGSHIMTVSEKIINFWTKPILFLQSSRDKWLFILFINAYSAVFLLFFQPFGVNNYDPTHQIRLELLLGIGAFFLVNTLVMCLYEFGVVPLVFRSPARYVFILNLLCLLVLLSTSTYLTYNYIGNFHDWSWSSYLGFIRDIGLMSSIPMVLLLLFLQQRQARREVAKLQDHVTEKNRPSNIICLSATNGKDKLYLAEDKMLLLEAQDNYVAVYYLENDLVKRALIRSSLKRLEKQIEGSPLLRCHRSYLVHPKQVEKISGNAHQLQIRLKGLDKIIPVSRQYVAAVTMPLDTRHT